MQTVYASEGGSRFHKSADCIAVERAQLIWDSDEWTAPSHPVESTTIVAAMGRGKEACSLCFPGLRAAWYRGSSENDYGHEPISDDREFFGEVSDDPPVCGRCTVTVRALAPVVVDVDMRGRRITEEQWVSYEVAVPWPCTSALVLGLAPREVTA